MTRMPLLSSPLLLGFEEMERLIDRVGKGGDGYPPYNIERVGPEGGGGDLLRITLAVAGFKRDQLDITLEDNQLIIRGRQEDDKSREFIHRGIAARQFSRSFVLADGIEVKSAAYLQTWAYAKLSTISFSVRPLLSHKLSSDSKEELRW